MASPPPSSDSQRLLLPTPFLTKTYQLVDDVSLDAIISWNEDGTAFVVWNPEEFARDVLPKHFKHNNFSSFVRQLNTYGFRKIIPDRWEFSNDSFRRGDKRLLCDIVRRKLAAPISGASFAAPPMKPSTSNSGDGQVFSWNSNSMPPTALLFIDESECLRNSGSSSSSSSSRAHLVDENYRLKKKNTQLCKELSQMKSMCTNIYSMMSNYNHGSGLVPELGQGPGPPMPMLGAVAVNSGQAESMMIPLHPISGQRFPAVQAVRAATLTDEHLSSNPSLFGFQLVSKRAREGEETSGSGGKPVEQDDLLQLQQPG